MRNLELLIIGIWIGAALLLANLVYLAVLSKRKTKGASNDSTPDSPGFASKKILPQPVPLHDLIHKIASTCGTWGLVIIGIVNLHYKH